MELEGYRKIDNTLNMEDISKKSTYFLIILGGIYGALYAVLHKRFFLKGLFEVDSIFNGEWNFFINLILFMAVYILLAVLHEGIHAITCMTHKSVGVKDIKFGIIMEYLAPYFHCKVPINVKKYREVLLMPTIILGFLPSLLGFLLGSTLLTSYGFLMTLGGIGDFMVYKALRKYNKDDLIMDNPDSIGFAAYVRETV